MVEKLYIRHCKYVMYLKSSITNIYGNRKVQQMTNTFRFENYNIEVLE